MRCVCKLCVPCTWPSAALPRASVRRVGAASCAVWGAAAAAPAVRGSFTVGAGGRRGGCAPPNRGAAAAAAPRGGWRRSASAAWERGAARRRLAAAAGLRREVVLTPATLLRRLEIIFPPAPDAASAAAGAACRGGASESHDERPPVLSGGLAGAPGGVRACCRPVPWERVVLRRAGQAPACDVSRQRASGALHTASAVYDVLVPSPFLFLPGVDAGDADGAAAPSLGAVRAAAATCRCPGRDRALLPPSRRRGAETRPAWCQRVGVLHHIPGLPDPSAPALTLREYADFAQSFSQPVEGGAMHWMTACGLSNRDAPDRGVGRRLGDAKRDGAHGRRGQGAGCRGLHGAVGVWIVDPWRESVFFAVRYRLGAEHYEWVRRPQHTFGQEGGPAPAAAAAGLPPEPSGVLSSGVGRGRGAPSFAWARAAVRQAMVASAASPARGTPAPRQPAKRGRRREEQVLSTVLYYCVAGTALTAAEKAAFLTRLLGGAGAEAEKGRGGDGVARLAKVWAPLPRSARLLRGRQVLADAAALAEAMKYGLLRLLP
ncbi:uncharacterized protein Tco025E_08192 [Trypanosoma conorhini]|uniref:Uncharacterized protein n=1 Tax=Trypanosoma conorhini TaxID=83891 RepID=A0A3S5IR02_9TRYP|nr:uncharacterized protein Tco025E_08192 [Trypanosoma conorhini]RNF03516.1 hypothetical protein Tco025E_08192 [Trypanosoma conorhini]